MPDYTVKDRETGQTIRFRWDGPQPPTEAELAEVFQSARQQQVKGPNWRMASPLGAMVGGLGGAMVGGPAGALVGAGLGGGLGKSAELYMQPDPELPGVIDRLLAAAIAGGQETLIEGAGQGMASLMKPTARRLMQSALKPDMDTVQSGRAVGVRSKADVAQTVLDEPHVYATTGSAQRIGERVDDINSSIARLIQQAGRQGTMVDVPTATKHIPEQMQTALYSANPTRDLQTVSNVTDEFLNHPLLKPGGFPIEDAQRLKVGTYRKLRKQYGEISSTANETEKALARGLKEGIAQQVPEVAAKNLEESKLLLISESLEKALARTGNRDPIGFANAAPATKRFWLALADRSPNVKIAIARALNVPVRRVAQMAPTLIRGGEIAVATDRREPLP